MAGARLDPRALRCATRLQVGLEPAPATLTLVESYGEARFKLEVNWDPDTVGAFVELPAAEAHGRTLPIDPYLLEPLEHFIRVHGDRRRRQRARRARPPARRARRGDRRGPPLARRRRRRARLRGPARRRAAPVPARRASSTRSSRGGCSSPTSRAWARPSRRWPRSRRTTPTRRSSSARPALKLNWQRETEHWLPHRTLHVVVGTGKAIPKADITVLNYEIVHAHRERLAISRPKALILDESHYVKNPAAKRTRAVRRLAEQLPEDALKICLTGTPVMNHPDELIAQLRIIGRLEEFGCGARFKRRFQGAGAEERIHWHLRRTCFVRRLKKDVLPQLPEKRQVVVPVALENEKEYRLAERDVIAWLQEQPLELSELEGKVQATLRAERLAQLNVLRRLAARGKLGPMLAWIDDFMQSEEPLVVFASHREIQEMVVQRFPEALHVVGADKARGARPRRPGLPGARRPAADRLLDPRRRPGHHAHPRLQRRLPRPRVEPGDARPGRGPHATASASATPSPPGTCSPRARSTSRWPRCWPASAGSSAPSPTAAATSPRRSCSPSSRRCAASRCAACAPSPSSRRGARSSVRATSQERRRRTRRQYRDRLSRRPRTGRRRSPGRFRRSMSRCQRAQRPRQRVAVRAQEDPRDRLERSRCCSAVLRSTQRVEDAEPDRDRRPAREHAEQHAERRPDGEDQPAGGERAHAAATLTAASPARPRSARSRGSRSARRRTGTSTNGISTSASAASLAASTRERLGPCVNSVFSVPQPYSLPSANTPSISANTPPKNGKPSSSVAGQRRAGGTGAMLVRVLGVERVRDDVGEEDPRAAVQIAEQDPRRGALAQDQQLGGDHADILPSRSQREEHVLERGAAAVVSSLTAMPAVDQHAVDARRRGAGRPSTRSVAFRARLRRSTPGMASSRRARRVQRLRAHPQPGAAAQLVDRALGDQRAVRGSRRRGRQICSTSPIRWLESTTVRSPCPSARISVAHLGHAGRVEPVRRLVEDQQLRVLEQRGGDAEPLLHAERVACATRSPARSSSSHLVEHGVDARLRARRRARPARAGCRARTGTGRRRAPRSSRRSAPAAAGGRAPPSTVALPDGRPHQPEQHPQRRRLPGAVGAEEAVDLAAPDAQVEIVDGVDASPRSAFVSACVSITSVVSCRERRSALRRLARYDHLVSAGSFRYLPGRTRSFRTTLARRCASSLDVVADRLLARRSHSSLANARCAGNDLGDV